MSPSSSRSARRGEPAAPSAASSGPSSVSVTSASTSCWLTVYLQLLAPSGKHRGSSLARPLASCLPYRLLAYHPGYRLFGLGWRRLLRPAQSQQAAPFRPVLAVRGRGHGGRAGTGRRRVAAGSA